MPNLLLTSYLIFFICVIAASKLLERAADSLTPEQRETLRQNMRISAIAKIIAITPILIAYYLIFTFPRHAVPIILITVSLLLIGQLYSYLHGVRKVQRLEMPASYVRSYKAFHLLINIGFVAALAGSLLQLPRGMTSHASNTESPKAAFLASRLI